MKSGPGVVSPSMLSAAKRALLIELLLKVAGGGSRKR